MKYNEDEDEIWLDDKEKNGQMCFNIQAYWGNEPCDQANKLQFYYHQSEKRTDISSKFSSGPPKLKFHTIM